MHLKRLISLSLSLCGSFAALLPLILAVNGAKRAGDAAWGTSSTLLPAAGVAVEGGGGGEITQPSPLPTPPKSVHRRLYNQINSMGPE